MKSTFALGTLVAAAVAWLLCCFHVVAAYVRSPGASAFRSEWQNRFSAEGHRHLRRGLTWGAVAVSLALISYASD